MTFENFARLTGAKLLNDPFISSFEKVETNPKKIKRGDLFIGDDQEDILLALQLEAYAIVSTTTLDIVDEEIAWFRVSSLDDILIRLLKFSLLEKKFHFVYACSIEIELIKKIAHKKYLIFLGNDKKENYKKIINADIDSIFFSANKHFLEQIYPEYQCIPSVEKLFKKDTKSLFLSSFTYREQNYKDIKITPLFLKYLESIVTFLEDNAITYEIEKCSFISHFYPIFINQKLQIKSFGKSEHVIICESDKIRVKETLTYLKTEAPWAKTVYIELSDLEKLKNIEFNFAIIVIDYNRLIDKLEKNEIKEQILLFKE